MAAEVPEHMTPGMRLVARCVGVLFIITGATKLVGLSAVKDYFADAGLPPLLVPIAGVAEIALGALMFRRKTWQFGSIGILVTMVFAALSHVMTGQRLYLLFLNAILINLCMWLLEKDPPRFLNVRRAPRASVGPR